MAGYVADCCRLRRARRKGVSLRSRACHVLALHPMDREAGRRERRLQQVEARLCPQGLRMSSFELNKTG